MQAKKQNDLIRQKLDQQNSVPENMNFNSALLWDKLEISLQQKKGRKTIWMFYAAATLIIILFTFIMINQHSKNAGTIAINDLINKEMELIPPFIWKEQSKMPQNMGGLNINKKASNRQGIIPGIMKQKKILLSLPLVKDTFSGITSQETAGKLNKSVISNVSIATQRREFDILRLPITKKLRVVPLNELGASVISDENKIAVSTNSGLFDKKIHNSAYQNNNNVYQPIKKRSLLTISLISSNNN